MSVSGLNEASRSSASKFGGGAEEIQDRFLKLLTAQLKNQDPLEPMDNSQVTSQMAQLSTVTGIQDLNKTMAGISDSFASADLLRATSLIGRSVVVEGDRLAVNKDSDTLASFDLGKSVGSATLEVKDAAGRVIYQEDLGPRGAGRHQIVWDGKDMNGDKLPEGLYKFSVTGINGTEQVDARELEQRVVLGVHNTGGALQFNIGGGEQVGVEDVLEFGA